MKRAGSTPPWTDARRRAHAFPEDGRPRIYKVYDREGIEYQQVFDLFLNEVLGRVDYKILSSAIVSYRRARDSYLVLYPHVNLTLLELLKRGMKLAVVSDAPRLQAWMRLAQLQLQHLFDTVVAFEDTGERKPSPKPFERAIEMLGISPAEAIHVGDWPERDMVGPPRWASAFALRRTFGTIHWADGFERRLRSGRHRGFADAAD
jgi:putative hydrolase of the HAD superfamily